MFPKVHLIAGFIFSIIVFLFFPQISWIGFILIFLSSFLVDIDHYLFYFWLKKDYSLKNAFKWFVEKTKQAFSLPKNQRKKLGEVPCIFHGLETTLVLIFLSFISKIFLYILIGALFHYLLDFLYLVQNGFSLRGHLGSQIFNIVKYNSSD